MNRRPAGRQELNQVLQTALNPAAERSRSAAVRLDVSHRGSRDSEREQLRPGRVQRRHAARSSRLTPSSTRSPSGLTGDVVYGSRRTRTKWSWPTPSPSTSRRAASSRGGHSPGDAALLAAPARLDLHRHHARQEAGGADRAAQGTGNSGEERTLAQAHHALGRTAGGSACGAGQSGAPHPAPNTRRVRHGCATQCKVKSLRFNPKDPFAYRKALARTRPRSGGDSVSPKAAAAAMRVAARSRVRCAF